MNISFHGKKENSDVAIASTQRKMEPTITSVYADKDNQIIRLLTSDIAAIAGFHPYKNRFELIDKYLYQDLDDLLAVDAKNLGITMIDKTQEISNIISCLPPLDVAKIQLLRDESKLRSITSDASASATLINQFNTVLESERIKKMIPEKSLTLLKNELTGDVRKRYGIDCESPVLDRYEEVTGYPVDSRNEETLVWPLHQSQFRMTEATGVVLGMETTSCTKEWIAIENQAYAVSNLRYSRFTHAHSIKRKSDKRGIMIQAQKQASLLIDLDCDRADTMSGPTPHRIGPFSSVTSIVTSERMSSEKMACTSTVIDLSDDLSDAEVTSGGAVRLSASISAGDGSVPVSVSALHPTPLFYIVGKVDGVSTQVDLSYEDATQWKQVRVVVEVKNRIGRIQVEPPLYDQIQLVTYMLMLGCGVGDLVQAISRVRDKGRDRRDWRRGGVGGSRESAGTSHRVSKDPASDPNNTANIISGTDTSMGIIDAQCTNGTGTSSGPDSSSHCPTRSTAASTAALPRRGAVQKGDFAVSRVELNAPPYFHRDNFFAIIMPRLKVFYDAIMRLRSEDSLRYQWLLCAEEEKLPLLHSLCPYMRDV